MFWVCKIFLFLIFYFVEVDLEYWSLLFTFKMNECFFESFFFFFLNINCILLMCQFVACSTLYWNRERAQDTPPRFFVAVVLINSLVVKGVDQSVLLSGRPKVKELTLKPAFSGLRLVSDLSVVNVGRLVLRFGTGFLIFRLSKYLVSETKLAD